MGTQIKEMLIIKIGLSSRPSVLISANSARLFLENEYSLGLMPTTKALTPSKDLFETKNDFWKQGVRFECQGSGQCCVSRGDYGFVYLSLSDRQRFATFFKLSTAAFTKKYCTKTDGWFHLTEFRRQCRFLDGTRCTVYEARPNQCRTWPFWPENMKAKSWNKEVVSFCPGVGKGKLYTAEEIQALLKLDPVDPAPR